MKAELIALWTT